MNLSDAFEIDSADKRIGIKNIEFRPEHTDEELAEKLKEVISTYRIMIGAQISMSNNQFQKSKNDIIDRENEAIDVMEALVNEIIALRKSMNAQIEMKNAYREAIFNLLTHLDKENVSTEQLLGFILNPAH